MSGWLSTTLVLSEASSRCQQWLNSIIAADPGLEDPAVPSVAHARLPWQEDAALSHQAQEELQRRVLRISEDPSVLLRDTPESLAAAVSAEQQASAGAVLQVDAGLKLLRYDLVPKRISEDQFWRRYWAAVAVARCDALACSDAPTGGAAPSASGAQQDGAVAAGRDSLHQSAAMDSASSDAATPQGLLVSNLLQTVSQVGSVAEELLSPRSLLSEQTAGLAAMSVGQPDHDSTPGAAAAASCACATGEHQQRQQQSRLLSVRSIAAAQPPELLWPPARGPLLGKRAASCVASPPQAAAQPTPMQRQGSGTLRPRRFHWHTTGLQAPLRPPATKPVGHEQEPPQPQAHAAVPMPARQPSLTESSSSDWSHASDQFLALTRELDAHDEDWMVL